MLGLRLARLLGAGLAGAYLGVALAGREFADIGPVRFALTASIDLTGRSSIDVPPLGRAWLDTHDGPLSLHARVVGKQPDELAELLTTGRVRSAFADGAAEFWDVMAALALRTTGAAVLGAAIVTVLVCRTAGQIAAGLSITMVLLLGTGGVMAATFRSEAVAAPMYTGFLVNVNSLVGEAEDLRRAGLLGEEELLLLARAALALNSSTDAMEPYRDGSGLTRVLQVSGSTSSAFATALRHLVADRYGVDLVIDTGNDVGRGTMSARSSLHLPAIGSPLLYLPGRFDEPADLPPLRELHDVTPLNGSVLSVAGLTVMGWPQGQPSADAVATVLEHERLSGEPVDVAVVGDRAVAERLAGSVPVVLAGGDGAAVATPLGPETMHLALGSTGLPVAGGGTPTGALESRVLYFREGALVAYDDIDLSGDSPSGAVTRVVL